MLSQGGTFQELSGRLAFIADSNCAEPELTCNKPAHTAASLRSSHSQPQAHLQPPLRSCQRATGHQIAWLPGGSPAHHSPTSRGAEPNAAPKRSRMKNS